MTGIVTAMTISPTSNPNHLRNARQISRAFLRQAQISSPQQHSLKTRVQKRKQVEDWQD